MFGDNIVEGAPFFGEYYFDYGCSGVRVPQLSCTAAPRSLRERETEKGREKERGETERAGERERESAQERDRNTTRTFFPNDFMSFAKVTTSVARFSMHETKLKGGRDV